MDDNYANKVFTFLNNMLIEEWYTIDRFVKKENQKDFVEVVKFYIQMHPNKIPAGNGIEFSNDYTKIRKQTMVKDMVAAIIKTKLSRNINNTNN